MELINDFVNVTSFSFYRSKLQNKQLKTFPKQIELGNNHYTFKDGFQYLVKSGEEMIRLFDMTDGHTTYRLRQDNDQWLLIGTRPA
jgi:hypothetical protein